MLEYVDIMLSFSVVMLLLSLLLTTLVQMVIAVSGLRGRILQWGLERILMQVEADMAAPLADAKKKNPACNLIQKVLGFCRGGRWAGYLCKTETHATKIANAVLRHTMLSHVGGQRATSIRKEELIRLLDDLASSANKVLPEATKKLLVTMMASAHTPDPAAHAKPTQEGQYALDATRKVVASVGVWFEIVMDRTSENFLLKTRWITAGVAAVFVFALQVDSLNIIQQLVTRPEVRAKLVQSADATLRQAEDTFALTAEKQALASKAIAAVRATPSFQTQFEALPKPPANLVTRAEGEAWLTAKLANATNQAEVLAAYDKQFEDLTAVWLGTLRQATGKIHTQLLETTLNIIPNPLPCPWDYRGSPAPWRHLLGILMSALFLSLGAPFWYNALRQLANLRPAVAEKIEPKSRGGK